MKKLLKSIVCASVFLLFFGQAIAQKTTFGLKPFAQKQTLRVGFFAGGPFAMPFYIAEKEGFFKELNIDIVYETFINGPAMMEANSTWDIASTGAGGALVGMLGYDVKLIGETDYERNIAVFVRPDSPLAKDPKNPANWKGTSWLYPLGTTAQPVLVAALKQVGLGIADVKSINMDVASALTGFMGKQGDGLVVWNTIALTAEDNKLVRLGDAATYNILTPAPLLATKAAMEKKKELLTMAYAVFYKTAEWAKATPENKKKANQLFLKSAKEEGLNITPTIAERAMNWVVAPTIEQNFDVMTKSAPDATGSYTKRPISQAEKNLLYGLMDFFISEKKYTVADRNKILDNKNFDASIATDAKKLLEAAAK